MTDTVGADGGADGEVLRGMAAEGGGQLVFVGVLSVLAGLFCVLAPTFMGWMGVLLFGIALCVLGGLQIVAGIGMDKGTRGRGWTIFGGAVAVVLGLVFVTRPFDVMAIATWIVGFFLLLEGGLRIGAALEIKPADGWTWVLIGGLASIVLGLLLLARWPYSAQWFLGTVIGIHFLFAGLARIMLGSALRKAARGA